MYSVSTGENELPFHVMPSSSTPIRPALAAPAIIASISVRNRCRAVSDQSGRLQRPFDPSGLAGRVAPHRRR